MIKEIYVKGMMCEKCKERVINSLSNLEKVNNVSIDLENGKVTLDLKEDIASQELKQRIEDLGYEFVN